MSIGRIDHCSALAAPRLCYLRNDTSLMSRKTVARASRAKELVPEGDTVFHRHPDYEEIIEVLSLYALDPPNKRITLKEMERELDAEYNIGLNGDGERTKKFLQNYIIPSVVVEPQWVREGIMEAQQDLNIPKRKMEVAERTQKRFERESRNKEASASEVATLSRATIDALEAAEESLERFGMYPSKDSGGDGTNINMEVDLEGVLETMMGSSKEEEPIDVDGEVREPE